MSLLRQGKAQVLTIYLGESDQWQGKPLYVAIVQFLREQGCAGATVTRAVAGYGAGSRLHESGGWRLSSDAPLVIQVIDQPDRLQRLLPRLEEMLHGGLMTLHDADVLKYTHARPHGLPAKLPVRQVMETAITAIAPETSVSSVVSLLLEAPFRVLPVVDRQQRLLGIISTGDLINAGILPVRRGLVRTALELGEEAAEVMKEPLARARESSLTAQAVMNRQVRTVRPDQSIREAAALMLETGLRRLPVVENDGTLRGMLTRADLLQAVVTSPLASPHAGSGTQPLRAARSAQSVEVQSQPVSGYMRTDVAYVEEQTPLADVIDALIMSPLKRVVVVDAARRVKGIISDVDVLVSVQEEARPRLLALLSGWARGKPVRVQTGALRTQHGQPRIAANVMNRDVITVTSTTPVQDTIEKMIAAQRKALPVVDEEGRLVGVVGRSDLLAILVES